MESSAASTSHVRNVKLASFMKRNRKRTIREHVSKGVIRRLARRGGVKRISALIYSEIRDVLKLYLSSLVKDSIVYCEYFKRKTVQPEDVVRAIKSRGQRLYGFDDKPFPHSKKSNLRMVDDSESTTQSFRAVTRSSARFRNNTESTWGITESTESVDSQRKKSTLQSTRENKVLDEDSDSTLEDLQVFQSSKRKDIPDSNDSVQVIDSEDDFVQPTGSK